MNMDMYYNVTSIFYNIQGYLEMLIIIMIMIRLDGRGPHDLLARTRVVLYDKNGNEVKDKMSMMVNEKMEEIKSTSKKVVDEEKVEEVDKNTYKEQTKKKEITSNKKKKTKKVIDEEPTK